MDYLFWAYRKLSESGSGVLAFVKSDFAQVVFYRSKDAQNTNLETSMVFKREKRSDPVED